MDASQATAKLLWALDRPAQPAGIMAAQAEEPRFPGTIPSIWNVPARNADFTGRGATLELLRDKLAGGGVAVVVAQALYGLGGVGKTQLALEYAHRFMADYDLVWWVPSERVEEITGALADLGRKMGLQIGDNVAEAAEAALEELRRDTTPHWLLIFDNADNPKQLEPYLPRGSGHVLITSRDQAWTHSAEPLEVDVFTRDESVAHLLRHVPELSVADAESVADALGHLPLAVEQASAWLEQTGMSARAYVDQLTTQSTRILALNQPSDYPMPVVATWNLSFDRLKERSPAAVRLLQILAFCSAGPISMDLLYSDEMNASLLRAIVKTCGSRSLSGFGLGFLAGSFDELAVDESRSGADQGDQMRCVDHPPAVLGGLDELERHRQPGRSRAGALCDLGPVPDGGEG
jgi:hypothetical protein